VTQKVELDKIVLFPLIVGIAISKAAINYTSKRVIPDELGSFCFISTSIDLRPKTLFRILEALGRYLQRLLTCASMSLAGLSARFFLRC